MKRLTSRISNVVANHTYIDTLPFDGIVVSFPDYQNCLGPNYIASYHPFTALPSSHIYVTVVGIHPQ